MNKIYLSGYFDADPIGDIIKQGTFFEDNCGGESIWTLSSKPNDECLIWSIPYLNKKYAYVFYPYDMNETTRFFDLLANEKDVKITKCETALVIQTDNLFSNWNNESGLWYNLESDNLEGTLTLITIN